MDQPTTSNNSKPSGLPRPSRLPVPRSGLRPTPSRENLQASRIANPRLRSAPSRDQLSGSTSLKPRVPSTSSRFQESASLRDRDHTAQTVTHNPQTHTPRRKASQDVLFRKPSASVLRREPLEPLDTGEDGELIEGDVGKDSGEEFSNLSRKSLSERAMETLQNIPSSPAIKKRTSSFYNPDSPMRPHSRSSRPGSSSQNDTSMGPPRIVSSRPTSSAGKDHSIPLDFRTSTIKLQPSQTLLQTATPLKRPGAAESLTTPSNNRGVIPTTSASASKSPSPASLRQRSPNPVKPSANIANVKPGSKTLAARPLKPRASMNGLFRKPSMPSLDQSAELDRIGFVPKKKSTTFSNTSSEGTASSRGSKATTVTSVSTDEQDRTPRKSSLALRDQITKAKAAKRAAAMKQVPNTASRDDEEVPVIASGTFDFGLSNDPFNQNASQSGAKALLRKRLDSARSDGRLNIAAMGFKEIPNEVMNMYDLDAMDGSWAEAVDLTRLVAADNEFELIGDDIFPDIDPRELADDEDAKGNQFGGLETLDLHGNVLLAIPLGLRRLEFLSVLNLSNNKLGNDCFQVISQIPSLRELKIVGNRLTGALDASITSLQNLEVLDLRSNALTLLPDGLSELVRLRILNISGNSFTSLPFDVLRRLPLIELVAAKNKLSGVLIGDGIDELPQLQLLDVTSNALMKISVSDQISLPSLHQLSCSSNRIIELPNMSTWTSLLTIAAEDNNISSLPEGFVTLPKVKNVNLSGNNIKILDVAIGGMANLDIFRISGNPLREKKFAGMTTDDLKRALKARMEPVDAEGDKDVDDGNFYSAPVSPISPSTSEWPVKSGGILDRSGTQSYSLNPVAAANVAAEHTIKELQLHHNSFKEIPSSIAFFAATMTTLSMAHNELTSDSFMKDDLALPALKELNLSSNTFNSLQPLFQRLHAPNLERLDISFNRISSLPPLRQYFPKLTTLLASHNTIKELSPEVVKGLRVLDCSSNDINSLNARIGLLGGPGGLERLDVSGNRFRVPKYTILEKGTEATLAWLRDKIPTGEVSAGTDEISPTDVD
ncbi:Leucine-rich repeat-containing 40 [Hyphodiscus hymeniophilus]|uniref:Leucine-rich repeat-containing 40 n=1 Tax=Hyphodiscus hymeniophilus TaxID=353542 RepID=A0A9P6VLS4_9HELO|nr:Leucine-rich repeat-containing 40 [Hyphodiscus hymeniophilus]